MSEMTFRNIIKTSLLLTLLLLASASVLPGQALSRAEDKFHAASDLYINKNFDQALATVKEGLKIKPDSEKLEALRKLLEQEKKNQEKQKQEQQQQNKEQQEKDQQKQEQDKQDQQQKDQQNKEEQEKSDEEQKKSEEEQRKGDEEQKDEQSSKPEDEQEKKDDEQKPAPSQPLEELKMSEEKAKMILEAMKNQEMQYLQQNKRKATQPRDRTKPDW
jgi:Ca-activated chloride channel family protein